MTKRSNRVDYQLEVKGKLKTFHINLQKKYEQMLMLMACFPNMEVIVSFQKLTSQKNTGK